MPHLPPHILIVDDNAGDRELLASWLREFSSEPYEITESPTLRDAAATLDANRISCILLDGFLGDGVCFDYLSTWSQTVPVVIISSHADDAFRERAMQAGAVLCLDKNTLDWQRLNREVSLVLTEKAARNRAS